MNHIEPGVPLEVLDPGEGDPGYWTRFQGRVMESVAPALAARRGARLTIGDAVLSWSRFFVPLAISAAACAVLFLLQHPASEVRTVAGIEEFLRSTQEEGGTPLPEFFLMDNPVEDRNIILLAVEGF